MPQRKRKRLRVGDSTVPAKRLRAERPNHFWALDFRFDTTIDGKTVRRAASATLSSREMTEQTSLNLSSIERTTGRGIGSLLHVTNPKITALPDFAKHYT